MLDQESFLSQEIESSSPAKLRWLLLRKAHGVCEMIDGFIARGEKQQAQNWLVLVHEILNELLSGITDPKHPSAKVISDLYVFLIKETYSVSQSLCRVKLKEVRDILEIELLTWDLFVKKENGQSVVSSLNPAAQFTPHFIAGIGRTESASSAVGGFGQASIEGSLNIEA